VPAGSAAAMRGFQNGLSRDISQQPRQLRIIVESLLEIKNEKIR
jgi:hypothetical protein